MDRTPRMAIFQQVYAAAYERTVRWVYHTGVSQPVLACQEEVVQRIGETKL